MFFRVWYETTNCVTIKYKSARSPKVDVVRKKYVSKDQLFSLTRNNRPNSTISRVFSPWIVIQLEKIQLWTLYERSNPLYIVPLWNSFSFVLMQPRLIADCLTKNLLNIAAPRFPIFLWEFRKWNHRPWPGTLPRRVRSRHFRNINGKSPKNRLIPFLPRLRTLSNQILVHGFIKNANFNLSRNENRYVWGHSLWVRLD